MTTYENLRGAEVEKLKSAFYIYESEKEPDKIDAVHLGDLLRAINFNPSLAKLNKLGQAKKEGEKYLTVDDCLKLYSDLKQEVKNMGCYEDFLECLKMYDKHETGWMQLTELQHSLMALGETLDDDEIEALFKDCMGEQNDEGEIQYVQFLNTMCGMKK